MYCMAYLGQGGTHDVLPAKRAFTDFCAVCLHLRAEEGAMELRSHLHVPFHKGQPQRGGPEHCVRLDDVPACQW